MDYTYIEITAILMHVLITGAAFGQADRSGGAFGQSAYGAYGSMLQQAGYAGAPGAAASPYGAGYGIPIYVL